MKKLIKHKNYWNKFYKNSDQVKRPSNFAVKIRKFLKNYNGSIVDVGCGNGRDLTYFINNKLNIIGIDMSKNAIEICKKKFQKKFIKIYSLMILLNSIIKKLKKIFPFIRGLPYTQ